MTLQEQNKLRKKIGSKLKETLSLKMWGVLSRFLNSENKRFKTIEEIFEFLLNYIEENEDSSSTGSSSGELKKEVGLIKGEYLEVQDLEAKVEELKEEQQKVSHKKPNRPIR